MVVQFQSEMIEQAWRQTTGVGSLLVSSLHMEKTKNVTWKCDKSVSSERLLLVTHFYKVFLIPKVYTTPLQPAPPVFKCISAVQCFAFLTFGRPATQLPSKHVWRLIFIYKHLSLGWLVSFS